MDKILTQTLVGIGIIAVVTLLSLFFLMGFAMFQMIGWYVLVVPLFFVGAFIVGNIALRILKWWITK